MPSAWDQAGGEGTSLVPFGVTSIFPVPHPLQGTIPMVLRDSQGVCGGCCVALVGPPPSLLVAGSEWDGWRAAALLLSVWARGRLGCVPTTSYLLYQ